MDIYRSVVEEYREDSGREVILGLPPSGVSMMYCPNCMYDAMNKVSSNVYKAKNPYPSGTPTVEYPDGIPGPTSFTKGSTCPICKGIGRLNMAASEITIKAFVRLLKEDTNNPKGAPETSNQVGGIVEYADFWIRAHENQYDNLNNAEYIIVDGYRTEILSVKKLFFGELFECEARARIAPGKYNGYGN